MRKDQGIRFFYENRSNNLPDLPMDEFYDNFVDEKYYQKMCSQDSYKNPNLASKNENSKGKKLLAKRTLFDDDEQDEESDVPNRVMKVISVSDNSQSNSQNSNKNKSQDLIKKSLFDKPAKNGSGRDFYKGKKTINSASTLQDEVWESDTNASTQNLDKQDKQQQNSTTSSIFKKFVNNGVVEKNKISKYDKYSNQQIEKFKVLPNETPFNFSKRIKIAYAQTPHFKNKLQSPFWKFNSDHRQMIETLKARALNHNFLQYNRTPKKDQTDFIGIDPFVSPADYFNDRIRYFVGIALKFKEMGLLAEARIFFKLACYVQPFNEKTWRKYIQFEQQSGAIYNAFILSKTAYLFTLSEEFAKIYISAGQKCGIKVSQLCGLIACVNNPDYYEKTLLVDLTKIDLKTSIGKQKQKGLKILSEVCYWNDYKLPVCSIIIFLAKLLENYGYPEKALSLLKRSFSKSMSKLEVYSTYIEIKIRYDKGQTSEDFIKDTLLGYSDYVSGENRYRLFLQLAEILFRRGDKSYKKYVVQAFQSAKKFCASGTGCNKTLRTIYFSVAKWKGVDPFHGIDQPFESDQVIFQKNRYLFSQGKSMIQYTFGDWKYYLHYGLERRIDLLVEGITKWPLTGRLVAELIHCMRAEGKKSKQEILQIWRNKIEEVPKSGQLWCEGGRIFAQLREYSNASKCFRSAIHFTPQYGDSFIEELKILLLGSRFHQIQKLKRIFFVSEPFYGHVWSYLRLNHDKKYKISLSQMWDNAMESINNELYQKNIRSFESSNTQSFIVTPNSVKVKPREKQTDKLVLTAYQPYNFAFLNSTEVSVRNKLFASYEQMENKN